MADIQLRLGKDMLVLTTSIAHQLEMQGSNAERDTAFTLLIEPEVIEDLYKLEAQCGVQCAVAPTAQLTPARLAHTGMEAAPEELAKQALEVVGEAAYQHVLVEVGPCGLPLDASSKASLLENRDQYASLARLFAGQEFDAFFLNGFSRVADLKCALMGIAKVSDAPVFASVDVDADGTLTSFAANGVSVGETLEEAIQAASELGAAAVGFCTDASAAKAASLANRLASVTDLPKMVQLYVRSADGACAEPYADADDIVEAAESLQASGIQFLRACGYAPASYAGALVAVTEATDVKRSAPATGPAFSPDQDIDELTARLKQRVNDSLRG